MLERVQKILAARGLCSRRKAEEYIEQGLVKVNGQVIKLGDKADPVTDAIEVDGKVTKERSELLYYLMNKPVGVVSSNVERWNENDPRKKLSEGQKRAQNRRGGKTAVPQSLKDTTVRDLLPTQLQGILYPVGRLDKDSQGLLLLTNDGALAHRLTHPKFDHEKEYDVTVNEPIFDGALQKMENGLLLDGTKTKPARIRRLGPNRFRIVLTEGRNRQIRRMCQKVGATVTKLVRVRILTISDSALGEGKIRQLTKEEKRELLQSAGLS